LASLEIRLLPSHRDWEIGAYVLSYLHFKEKLPRYLRKSFPGCKTGKSFFLLLLFLRFIPQRDREKTVIAKFSKINSIYIYIWNSGLSVRKKPS
jgi:hypothetical protein